MRKSDILALFIAAIGVVILLQKGDLPVIPDFDPAPIELEEFYTVVIEDRSQRNQLSKEMIAALTSQQVEDAATRGGGVYELVDSAQDVRELPEPVQAAIKRTTELPWLVVSNGDSGYEGPHPQTLEDTLATINKYK